MTESVQFNVLVKDLGSSPLARFAANARKSVNKVQKLQRGLDSSVTRTAKNFNKLNTQVNRVGKTSGIRNLNKDLKTTSGMLDRITNKVNKIKMSASRGGGAGGSRSGGGMLGLGGLKTMFGAYLGFEGAKALISSGAELQSTKAQFGSLLQDDGKGERMVKTINKLANVTPYFNSALLKSGQTMLAFGIAENKILPNLRTLGDIAGGNAERFRALSLAYSQTQAAGKLMGQDLNQMVQSGFNPLLEMSKMTGKSMGTLKEEMAEGAISADMVAKAFEHATSKGGRFYKNMEKQSKTLAGRWSTLIGTLQNKFAVFMESNANTPLKRLVELGIEITNKWGTVSRAFGRLYDAVTPAFTSLGNLVSVIFNFNQGGSVAQKIVNGLAMAVNLITPVIRLASGWISTFLTFIKNNWSWLKYLAGGIIAVVAAVKAWRIAQIALNIALSANPIGAVIAAIGALVGGIVWAWQNFGMFRGVILGVWEVMKSFASGIGDLFTSPWKTIKSVFNKITSFVGKQIQPLFEMIQAIKAGEWMQAAKAGGKLLFNLSPIGTITNVVSEVANSDSFKKGFEKGMSKDSKISMPKFLTEGISMPGNKLAKDYAGIVNAGGGGGYDSTAIKNEMQKAGQAQTIGYKGSGSGSGGGGLNVTIDALMRDTTVNISGETDYKDFEKRMSESLVKVVRDVEISYS